MRALVTGGAGLIGSHLADLLLKKGYQVRILDNLCKPTHEGKPDYIPKEAEFILGDVRDLETVKKALKDIDYVFHQAAVGGFMPEIGYYSDVNCKGTALLMEVIIKEKLPIKKFVLASSQAVYGEGKYECETHGIKNPELRGIEQLKKEEWEVKCPECGKDLVPVATDEESMIGGDTTYALSKYFQEKLVLSLGQKYNIPAVALRYSMTYGPRQSLSNPYTGVFSIFSTQIINNKPPVIYENGVQTRDLTYVEDVARANLFVAEHPEITNDYFNVGTGTNTKISTLAEELISAYGKDFKPDYTKEFRPGEVRHLFSDPSKLEKYGFKAVVGVKEGLKKYVEWFSEQKDVKEKYSNAELGLKKMNVVMGTDK